MTPLQQLSSELQFASNETEVFLVWTRHRDQLKQSSLILSVPGNSPFDVKLPKYLEGGGRIVSAFTHENLFFLNEDIYAEMLAGRECTFRIAYTLSFDTNTASYLRGLFENRNIHARKGLQQLLLNIYPRKLNWQVLPYLLENSGAILEKKNDQVIFETVLAAERLQTIDINHLRQFGEIRFVDDENLARTRAAKRLSDMARHFSNGMYISVLERWEAIYVVVLFTAIQQIQKPSVERASKKLKALIQFMDEELHALFLEFLFIAWDWFSKGKNTSIFDKLQRNAPDILTKAKNIAWDVFHVTQLRQEATFVEKDASFLVPFFLTFDQALAGLASFSAMKSCLINGAFHYPMCFTNSDPDVLFSPAIGQDDEFIDRYLSVDANSRRNSWLDRNGWPNLTDIRQSLEKELLNCGVARR